MGMKNRDKSNGFDRDHLAYIPTTGVRTVFETPLVQATEGSVKGYGHVIPANSDPDKFPIEIARWPAQGWRSVDANSGDQGGTTAGVFELWWKGETLYARNNAVGDNYLFAWSNWPEEATSETNGNVGSKKRDRALVWRANYHPDGGQLFFPLDGQSFVVPLALPGDDVKPEDFETSRVDGGCGLHIHPDIWHGPIMPIDDHGRFFDKQGRVHARVSVDFAKEFGRYLSSPLLPVQER